MDVQYHACVTTEVAMQAPGVSEWISRCARRLQAQWSRVDPLELEQAAVDLLRDPRMRTMAPERAADEWLRMGVLGQALEPAAPDAGSTVPRILHR